MPTHITIIIAHSQPLLRLLLQNIFSSKPGIAIAAVVANTSGLLKAIAIHRPDIIVADISLPRMRRLPQLAAVAQREKPLRIIFWWKYCHEALVRKMINNTASFIAEDAPLSAYVVALKEVMKGAIYHCPQTEKLAGSKNDNMIALVQKLNEKYVLLLHCVLNNYSIAETATATDLKESTVKTYRKRLKKIIGSYSYAAIENVLKKMVSGK